MTNTSDDMLAAAKGSKATAGASGERQLDEDYKRTRKRKLSYETTRTRRGVAEAASASP